jgi:hypothetical protein
MVIHIDPAIAKRGSKNGRHRNTDVVSPWRRTACQQFVREVEHTASAASFRKARRVFRESCTRHRWFSCVAVRGIPESVENVITRPVPMAALHGTSS